VVAQLLRLKLTLLRNTFRRSTWQLVAMALSLVYGLGLSVFVIGGLFALRSATPDIARSIVVVFGSFVVLAFLLLPLVFGVDDTIDPRRFSLYGIPTTKLAFGLAVAAAVSVPTLVVTLFSLAQIVTWSRGPGPTLLALLAAILIVPTCVLAARVSTGIASFFLASRRARDISGVLLLVVLAVAAPLVALLAMIDWESQGLPIARRIAAVVAWTPLGAAWSLPGDAAVDNSAVVLPHLLIAVGFLIVLWLVWRLIVGTMLVTQLQQAAAKRYTGLGWFERMPATPTGAIAARSLSYWSRDARYRVAIVVIPIVPIVMVAALVVGGVPWSFIAWIPVPIMCLFLGWSPHNDVAYDNTAFWTHVSANTSGRADRWGRLVPALFLGVPLVLVGSVVTTAFSGQWSALPALIGLSACILLVGFGISSVISAGFPYPVVRPGDSPFAQPQVAGTAGSVVQSVSFFATAISATPVVLIGLFLGPSSPAWYWVALGTGVAIGLLVLFGGVRLGGYLMGRRAPELLAFAMQN
jgi:ABC-2 type transport system permease protein